jgi:hypothetical protein
VSADRISKLVAQAAEREMAPVPVDMVPLVSAVDGIEFHAYYTGGDVVWRPESDPPAGARQLYVRAV